MLAERGSESGSNVFSSDRNLVRNRGQSKAAAIPLVGKLLDVPILSHEQTFKTFYLNGVITFVLILTIAVQSSPYNRTTTKDKDHVSHRNAKLLALLDVFALAPVLLLESGRRTFPWEKTSCSRSMFTL